MHDELRLLAPLRVTREDVEKVLVEQCNDEPAAARLLEQLRADAERAMEELNRALAVDVFDILAQGWAQVPAVHSAVQLSALTNRPQTLINLDSHQIASTSRVVLDTHLGRYALPPLQMNLELLVNVQSASLAAFAGRIDVAALGQASVSARLTYKSIVVKEHETDIAGMPREPSPERATDAERPATVDFLI